MEMYLNLSNLREVVKIHIVHIHIVYMKRGGGGQPGILVDKKKQIEGTEELISISELSPSICKVEYFEKLYLMLEQEGRNFEDFCGKFVKMSN